MYEVIIKWVFLFIKVCRKYSKEAYKKNTRSDEFWKKKHKIVCVYNDTHVDNTIDNAY